jgi:hypothetical protein
MFIETAGLGLSFIMSYSIAFLFGIPTILILKKTRKESHRLYSILGFVSGASYIILINIITIEYETMIASLLFGGIGLVTALCFSLIQGNENNTHALKTKNP